MALLILSDCCEWKYHVIAQYQRIKKIQSSLKRKKQGIMPLRCLPSYAVQPPAILNHLVPISGYSISWNIITLEKRAMHYDPVWMHSWIFLTCNKLVRFFVFLFFYFFLGHLFLWGISSTNLINLGLWKQQYIKYQKEHGLKGWGWCFLMTFFFLLISWCSNTKTARHSSCCLCQCLRQWITGTERLWKTGQTSVRVSLWRYIPLAIETHTLTQICIVHTEDTDCYSAPLGIKNNKVCV